MKERNGERERERDGGHTCAVDVVRSAVTGISPVVFGLLCLYLCLCLCLCLCWGDVHLFLGFTVVVESALEDEVIEGRFFRYEEVYISSLGVKFEG